MSRSHLNPSNDLSSTPKTVVANDNEGLSHGLNQVVLQKCAELPGADFLRVGSPHSIYQPIYLRRTHGLRHNFVELAPRKGSGADDHFLRGESDNHKLWCKQHTELGGNRSDDY